MMDKKAPEPGSGTCASGKSGNTPHRDASADVQSPAAKEFRAALRPVTVMIVEDSSIVRERLVGLVSDLHNVVIVGEAADGFQAQALFRQHRPDAVILDIQLPGIDGMDLLAQFKTEHPACVVVVLTTYAFKEFRQRCTALGSDHFFDKATEFERAIEVLAAFEPRSRLAVGN
jgi:DNA-binding NarL/FixJ family response regulator